MAILEEFDDAPRASQEAQDSARPNFSPSPSPLKVPSMNEIAQAAKVPAPPTPGRQLTREEKMNARRRGNKDEAAFALPNAMAFFSQTTTTTTLTTSTTSKRPAGTDSDGESVPRKRVKAKPATKSAQDLFTKSPQASANGFNPLLDSDDEDSVRPSSQKAPASQTNKRAKEGFAMRKSPNKGRASDKLPVSSPAVSASATSAVVMIPPQAVRPVASNGKGKQAAKASAPKGKEKAQESEEDDDLPAVEDMHAEPAQSTSKHSQATKAKPTKDVIAKEKAPAKDKAAPKAKAAPKKVAPKKKPVEDLPELDEELEEPPAKALKPKAVAKKPVSKKKPVVPDDDEEMEAAPVSKSKPKSKGKVADAPTNESDEEMEEPPAKSKSKAAKAKPAAKEPVAPASKSKGIDSAASNSKATKSFASISKAKAGKDPIASTSKVKAKPGPKKKAEKEDGPSKRAKGKRKASVLDEDDEMSENLIVNLLEDAVEDTLTSSSKLPADEYKQLKKHLSRFSKAAETSLHLTTGSGSMNSNSLKRKKMEADLKQLQKQREATAKDMHEEEVLWHQSRARVEKVLSMHELAVNLEAAACSYDVHFEETQELQLTQYPLTLRAMLAKLIPRIGSKTAEESASGKDEIAGLCSRLKYFNELLEKNA